jgi:hypothetical protein
MILGVTRKSEGFDLHNVSVTVSVRVQPFDIPESNLVLSFVLVSLSIGIQRNLPMGWLEVISLVAIITTAGFAVRGTRMTEGAVVEFRRASERVNGQKVIDVLVILVRAVRRECRS